MRSILIILSIGWAAAFADPSLLDTPKRYECVGWLLAGNHLNELGDGAFQTRALRSPQEWDHLGPLGITMTEWVYYHNLAVEIGRAESEPRRRRHLFYVDGYPAIEVLQSLIYAHMGAMWAMDNALDHQWANMRGVWWDAWRRLGHVLVLFGGTVAAAVVHFNGVNWFGYDASFFPYTRIGVFLAGIPPAVAAVRWFLKLNEYMGMDPHQINRKLVEKSIPGFKLETSSSRIADALSEGATSPWSHTIGMRIGRYGTIHDGEFQLTYGYRSVDGKFVPFLVLGTSYLDLSK